MSPLKLFKCLSDDTRLRCILLIQNEGELCVCELMEALKEIQPKISRHLAQLRECELLLDQRRGQWVFYRLNPSLPEWVNTLLEDVLVSNREFLKKNIENLAQMGTRPERVKSCCKVEA